MTMTERRAGGTASRTSGEGFERGRQGRRRRGAGGGGPGHARGEVEVASPVRVASKELSLCALGGDFFEIRRHADGAVTAVLADVCGSGASAALVADGLRPVLRALLAGDLAPAALLVLLNDWLARDPAALQERFVTAVAVRVDGRGRRIDVASAGHLGPFIRRRSGAVESLNFVAGVPLGMLPRQSYTQLSRDLQPDDAVVLATDGVTDPLAAPGDPLGDRALLRRLAAASHTPAAICQALLPDCALPKDDATIVALQVGMTAPAPAPRGGVTAPIS